MYSDEKLEVEQEVEVDIHPISKWKRILIFLGDFMLHFMLSLILFVIAIQPLANLISNNKKRTQEINTQEEIRDDILYGNELLFYSEEYPRYSYSQNFYFTFYRWLSYYVLDEAVSSETPYYAHIEENEIFAHYYSANKATYINLLKTQDKDTYFSIDSENNITMLGEYRIELRYFFIPNESLSKTGQKYFKALSNTYVILYKTMLEDILDNDLTYTIDGVEYSYITASNRIDSLNNANRWVVSIGSIVAYVIGWGVIYLLIPLISKFGRTPTMMILKAERVGMNNLMILRRGEVALTSAYSLFIGMGSIPFIPVTYTNWSLITMIKIPVLSYLALLAVLMALVSLFIIIFNNFNRSLSDLLSRSVMVLSEDLDEVERKKNELKPQYGIRR